MRNLLFLVLIGLSTISCSKDKTNTTPLITISYGTSFGMCAGHCKNELTIQENHASLIRSSWNNELKPIVCQVEITEEDWNALQQAADQEKLSALPDIIGCPDCADGGAEWVSIRTENGFQKKVTFEYAKSPAPIAQLVERLRFIFQDNEACGNDELFSKIL